LNPSPTFNLIGPGRLGQTLARLWQDAGLLQTVGVLGRDRQRAQAACEFIGAGSVRDWDTLTPTAITLLATPDDALAATARQLADSAALSAGAIVFHCSGAQSSALLAPLHARGALVASIHPLKSFAAPERAIRDFAGTCCACEGDAAALTALAPLFDAIGARRFAVAADAKLLYHAGAVLACNHLVALMDAALRCLEQAGLPRNEAWPALRPLIDGTLDNIDHGGTQAALTGPVARGDMATVERETVATRAAGAEVSDAYHLLSQLALQLRQRAG